MADPSQALAREYSGLAEAYARYWGPVIHPMAAPLFAAIPLTTARRLLDVGTGTGGLWPAIRAAAPLAALWGMDRAAGMLRAGGDLLRGRVAVMDAARLGFRPARFDAALLVFVLFHLPDPVAALREIRTMLRPGGSLGVVVWGEDPGLPGAALWTEELDHAGAAPDPRDAAVMRQAWMDTPEKLAGLLEQAGFRDVRTWSERFVHQWTPERLLATQLHCGLPSRRLGTLPADAQAGCTGRVRARIEALTSRELAYRVEVLYGIAQGRP